MLKISAFAPATVANVGPCFDCAGFAVAGPGDIVMAQWSDTGRIEIVEIEGDGGKLPRDPAKNTAGVVATEILKLAGEKRGVKLWLEKKMPLFSGLGSSAASSAATVVAVNALLENRFEKIELLPACQKGEEIACGAGHLDNVAPSLLGGLTIIENNKAEKVALPFDFTVVLVAPDFKLPTAHSRSAIASIRKEIEEHAVQQTAKLRSAKSLSDFADVINSNDLLEKARGTLIPGFLSVKTAGLSAGALAVTISGSGPSVFAITESSKAEAVKSAIISAFGKEASLKSQGWIAKLDPVGARVIEKS